MTQSDLCRMCRKCRHYKLVALSQTTLYGAWRVVPGCSPIDEEFTMSETSQDHGINAREVSNKGNIAQCYCQSSGSRLCSHWCYHSLTWTCQQRNGNPMDGNAG